MRSDLFALRLFLLRGGDFLKLAHPIEHRVALRDRALWVLQGREPIRAADQSRQYGRFRKIEPRSVFSEVRLRRCFDAVTTRAEIDSVDVKFEDLVLRQLAFDPQRDHRLENFPADRAT